MPARSNLKKVISPSDFGILKKNLEEVAKYYILKALWVMVHSQVHLLATAVPRTPVDTGLLRESAQVKLKSKKFSGTVLAKVAKGKRDGSIEVNYDTVNSVISRMSPERIKNAAVEVVYNRVKRGNFDVAVFTHEELNPYRGRPEKPKKLPRKNKRKNTSKGYSRRGEKRKLYARVPGTGPKYLERSWNQNKSMYRLFYRKMLEGKVIASELRKHLKVSKSKKGPHMVDIVKLSIGPQAFNKLTKLGGLR